MSSARPDDRAPCLCLASASPRRRALLEQIGVPHCVRAAHIIETRAPGETPQEYVLRLAREKALAAVAAGEMLPVLAADTAVVLDDTVYGKPRDRGQALAMLAALAGRTHHVLTGVALAHGGQVRTALSSSAVHFRELTAAECEAYWASGEPCDKAGGYAVQGRAAVFIERLHGSYSGVMGLPLFETAQLLAAAGLIPWLHASGAAR